MIAILVLPHLLACTSSGDGDDDVLKVPGETLPTNTGDDDDDDTTDTPTTPTADTARAPTGTTADTATLDCSVRPPVPFQWSPALTGFSTAEDFDFDMSGLHVSVQGGNLIGIDMAGAASPLAFGVGFSAAGTRVLSTGDVLICDGGVGGLTLVDMTTGGNRTIISNMAYPNGLEVDAQNRAYVADQSRGAVLMVDVYAKPVQVWRVAEGLNNPNGVILSPDEQTLYVGSFGGNVIYAVDRITDTEWDTPRIIHQAPAGGGYDGINVDMCGTVYFTEWITGRVWRVDPTGKLPSQRAAQLPSSWIPNMRWGHGIGGWDANTLYVADRDQGRLFGLRIGIPGKPHVGLP